MINLSNVMSVATRAFGRGGLILSKHGPEILTGLGIAAIPVSTYLACRATLESQKVIDDTNDAIDAIHEVYEEAQDANKEAYTEKDVQQSLATVYMRRAIQIGGLYLPAIAVGTLGVSCLIGSHHILSKRNVALMGAYKLLDESYRSYRERVKEQFAPDSSKDTLPESKALKSEKAAVANLWKKNGEWINGNSPYAKVFEEKTSVYWKGNPVYDEDFIKSQQVFANQRLHATGHIFLNEVYDMLGFQQIPAGQAVGWLDNEDNGDCYVDFDIYNARNSQPGEDFTHGYDQAWILDFNVDGVIWDKI